jgi:hypothetical protein
MQRTMIEMVKAFTDAHGDRMEKVRREIEEIRQLSDQMRTLRERAPQIASRNQATAPDPAA